MARVSIVCELEPECLAELVSLMGEIPGLELVHMEMGHRSTERTIRPKQVEPGFREILQRFVDEECVVDSQAVAPTAQLFRAFRQYAEERNYHAGSLRCFSSGIRALGFGDWRTKKQRMKKGLRLSM